jgi:hypothetical protein
MNKEIINEGDCGIVYESYGSLSQDRRVTSYK